MPDQPLWDAINRKARDHTVILANSFDDMERGTSELMKTDAPEVTSLKNPLTGNVLMIKQGGIWHTTAGICIQYGVALALANKATGIHDMIPLTNRDMSKLLAAVQAKCHDLPKPTRGGSGKNNSAFKSSQREGRVSATGPPAPFGTQMKTARGGGLVQAANTGYPREVLTPPDYSDSWVRVGQKPADKATFNAMRQVIRQSAP
jgi:hypothetical protein